MGREANGDVYVTDEMAAASEEVFKEWEKRVRESVAHADRLQQPVLIDTLPMLYKNITAKIGAVEEGYPDTGYSTIAQEHGSERARLTQYEAQSIVHEYQILRQTILHVLAARSVVLSVECLNVLNAEIDDAVRESIAGFIMAQTANREQFFAALTHDLRTPLGTANMAVQLIARCDDLERARYLADIAAKQHHQLDVMIKDMLDLMVMKSNANHMLELTQFDFSELVKEVIAHAILVGQRNITFSGDQVVGYWCRPAIRRAIENLVSNAVKYSVPNTPIELQVTEYNGRVALSVSNIGPPIPAEQAETIFQLFRRRHADKRTSGWGIGLPYVRSVAESHGGSVALECDATKTKFVFDVLIDPRPALDGSES